MAESTKKNLNQSKEISTCPICFETYKTPRNLPCLHTFCHNCLASYIISTCKIKQNPVGFPCPICRRFVPAPTFTAEIEKWAELMPINRMVNMLNEKYCDACKRADEEEVASDWCKSCLESLCGPCAKAHKRNVLSKNHELISVENFQKVSKGNENYDLVNVFCQEHSNQVEYLCVDHEELCCSRCVCTKHRKCNQIDAIEEAAENLRKSEKLEALSQEISKFEGILIKAKLETETTIGYIDDTSDKIREESTDLRNKIVNHVDALLEDHLSDLARNVKGQKDMLTSFGDAVSDRQLLMAQYLQTLKCAEKTPPSVLVQEYFKIKGQFRHVTRSDLSKCKLKLNADVSKDLTGILEVTKFADLKTKTTSIPLSGIDMTCATMKLVCELDDSNVGVTGGCFLQNGDIILADHNHSQLLHYSNKKLVHKTNLGFQPQDAVCQNSSVLFVSKNIYRSKGYVGKFNLDRFENIEGQMITNSHVNQLAVTSGYVYAACSSFIVKFDLEGNIVQRYDEVEDWTYSVAVNNRDEIISSSCLTQHVTVMENSGKKMYSYSHEKLINPRGLNVNFSRNIFVAGQWSQNIHVLTPKAELLKIFDVASPRFIRFKENSYVCLVGSGNSTKVYEFQEDL
ncbi:E3 ubiquitin-protein ligase TRIM39-like [Crassostrea angulata]|uniref:E3 ubiquitin-protein ligase TRIM39-like n=1 Tax=Magallana angulata TaxID=2784310 RepID=UPI0022B12433|nr:E3 ubiquitin-protein ligase TRIM39-like [Crassostrea angulata]